MNLRLLSYNIRFGGRGRQEALAAVIRSADPDIVALQEATDRQVIAELSQMTGLPEWDARTNSSTAFLTRLNVQDYAWHLPRGARHPFLEIALEHPAMRIFCLHLSAWFSKWSERRRAFEIKALLDGIREHQHGLHIITGDFNAVAPGDLLHTARMPRWIRGMIWLSGRDIARTTIQHMLDRGYVDAWRMLHPDDPGYGFPTWDPHVRLDYAFIPSAFSMVHSCSVLDAPREARNASDHFPLLLELRIPQA